MSQKNDAPEEKDASSTSLDAQPVSDDAIAAAAGGGSLKSLFMDVQRGLWADKPEILREIMERHGAKSAAPGGVPGGGGKDV